MSDLLERSPQTYARTAGILYLVIAIFGAFGIAYVPSVIVIADDGAATARNLLDHQGLFAAGVFADVVVLLAEVVLTVMLYELLKPVSRSLSMIAAFARLAMVLVMAVNILINLMPLVILTMPAFAENFEAAQLETLALGFFEAHALGIYIWGILFGLHLFALGNLVCNSGYFPKVLGAMMGLGAFGYTVQGVAQITGVDNAILSIAIIGLLVLVTLGELAFAFWLLIKGLDVEKWRAAQ